MTWDNINLQSRIIRLHANQAKERQPKRVPIHQVLVSILKRVIGVRSISSDKALLTNRGKPPSPDSLKKPWRMAIKAVGLNPAPTIHDLRHVWKTSAMRSGMDFEIPETILGHATGIAGAYGVKSDRDLISAIDDMKLNLGKIEMRIARKAK